MSNILYFPGNSIKNKGELEIVRDHLRAQNLDVYAQEWAHWTDESLEFDLLREFATAEAQLTDLDSVILIGKSIGTLMACYIATKFAGKVEKLILCGLPDQILQENIQTYTDAIAKANQAFVVQNEKDPFGAADKVKGMLNDSKIEWRVQANVDTHVYEYPELIASLL